MSSVRLQRVAALMREVVGQVVTQELRDPRCGFITVVGVKVAPDLKTAQVDFSVLGTESEKRTALRALEHARGFIQARVAEEMQLKYTPVLGFHLDVSIERDIELLRKIERTVESDRRAAAARAIRSRDAGGYVSDEVSAGMSAAADSEEFREYLAGLMGGLAEVDTTPGGEIADLAARERRCQGVLESALRQTWGEEIELELVPIDPGIQGDSAYTPPAYAAGAEGGVPPAERVYEGRGNLIAVLRGAGIEAATAGKMPASHTGGTPVPPNAGETSALHEGRMPSSQVPQSTEGEAPTDGSVAAVAPLRLVLHAHLDTGGPYEGFSREGDWVRGSGCLDGKGQAAMIAGALWLLRRLREKLGVRVLGDVCADFVIDGTAGGNGSLCLALQDPFSFDGIVVCEPTGLRVCTGGLGEVQYRAVVSGQWSVSGEQSAVSGEQGVNATLRGRGAELADEVARALKAECLAIAAEGEHPLFPERPAFAGPRVTEGKELAGGPVEQTVIEGTLRFLPTHGLGTVTSRLSDAARGAVAEFCRRTGLRRNCAEVRVSFERLLRNAFFRETDSALAVCALASCRLAGLADVTGPSGWGSHGDAGVFADLFRDRDVMVFGAGELPGAGEGERMSLHELAAGAKMLAFLVLETAGLTT